MKWKVLLVALLILGIAGILLMSESGVSYLNLLKRKVGDFVSIVFKWVPGGKQFYISLTADKEVFYGKTYKVSNTTFEGSGKVKELKINNAVSPLDQIDIKIEGMKGSFETTKQNTVKISADASSVVLNNIPILNLNIYLEMIPSKFSLSQFNTDKMEFSSMSGQIKTEEGWVKNLNNSDVEISGFKGSLELKENQVFLEGLAKKLIIDGKEISIG
jgi:hypothetical protein